MFVNFLLSTREVEYLYNVLELAVKKPKEIIYRYVSYLLTMPSRCYAYTTRNLAAIVEFRTSLF